MPDLVLGIKRRSVPNDAYNATHSIAYLVACSVGVWFVDATLGQLVFWCLLSHIALDLPTHGPVWAPPLLWPFRPTRFNYGGEWEFFNRWWIQGLVYSIAWATFFLLF